MTPNKTHKLQEYFTVKYTKFTQNSKLPDSCDNVLNCNGYKKSWWSKQCYYTAIGGIFRNAIRLSDN